MRSTTIRSNILKTFLAPLLTMTIAGWSVSASADYQFPRNKIEFRGLSEQDRSEINSLISSEKLDTPGLITLGDGTAAEHYIQVLRKAIKNDSTNPALPFYERQFKDGYGGGTLENNVITEYADDPALSPEENMAALPNSMFNILYKDQSATTLKSYTASVKIALDYVKKNSSNYFQKSCDRYLPILQPSLAEIMASTNPYIEYPQNEPRLLQGMSDYRLGRLTSKISTLLAYNDQDGGLVYGVTNKPIFECPESAEASYEEGFQGNTTLGSFNYLSVARGTASPIFLFPAANDRAQKKARLEVGRTKPYGVQGTMIHELLHFSGITNENPVYAYTSCFTEVPGRDCLLAKRMSYVELFANLSRTFQRQEAVKEYYTLIKFVERRFPEVYYKTLLYVLTNKIHDELVLTYFAKMNCGGFSADSCRKTIDNKSLERISALSLSRCGDFVNYLPVKPDPSFCSETAGLTKNIALKLFNKIE